jgi:hypothetical protein
MFNEQIFWKEGFTDGEAKGGFFVRAVELVGLCFSDNNLEVIVTPKK